MQRKCYASQPLRTLRMSGSGFAAKIVDGAVVGGLIVVGPFLIGGSKA